MHSEANSCGLVLDFVISGSFADTQRWILSAMQRYGPELVTMLWRILGSEQDVCDVYQDTFLKLAHYEGGGRPANVRAYIFRSASNAAISLLRRRLTERKSLMEICAMKKTGDAATEDIDSRLLQENLRRNIAGLPEHFRNVVILRDLAELSYVQVGRILGITAGTARVYRCKAIQLLSVWMKREEE
jgi:RNA polymerase sigma factor (sigma-70 family)